MELFQKLDAEEVLRLAKAFTLREVADGDHIVSEGGAPTGAPVVVVVSVGQHLRFLTISIVRC